MSETSVRIFYRRSEFTSLVTATINRELLAVALAALALSVPIADVTLLPLDAGVAVEWDTLPTAADKTAVSAAIAAHVGASTTSQPFEWNSFAASTAANATRVSKIDQTTPPLDPGTYQVLWTSTLRMQALIANTGIEGKIRITRSDGTFVEQVDTWDLSFAHVFNGGITFVVQAGQTIRAELSFVRLGASGVAEMSGARITVDQLSAA